MNHKSLKIVYLIPGGLYNPGGMERTTILKANYLADKESYDVFIVTTEQMGRPVFFHVSDKVHLIHLDIGIHENFGKENYLQKCVSRFFKTREYVRKLKKTLHQIRPDITVSLLGLDIEFLNNFKDGSIKIGELHFPSNFRQLMARKLSNAFIPNLVAKIRTGNLKKACRKLTCLAVLTQEEKSAWKDAHNIVVIPNALSCFPTTTSTCEPKKAIFAGRLVYEKGVDLLIESWAIVFQQHPDWELHIYGQGNEKDNLSRLIHEKGLDAVVKIHPPEKDIYKQYVEHSMFIFPSRYLEAFGMVQTEAMSCGLPIVAFDAPCGPKDIIVNGQNGFLVKTGDIEAMADRINTLIESEELRKSMGAIAREMSLNYSEENVMRQWLDLFETLQNEK